MSVRCVSAPPYGTGLPVVTPVTLPPRAQSAPPIVPEARSCNGYVELSNGKQIWDELELKGLATKNPAVWPQKTLFVEEVEGLGARNIPPSTERRSHRKYEVSINFFYAMVRKQCTEGGDGVLKIPTETVFYLLLAYTAFCTMRESSGDMKHVQVSFLRKLLQTPETIEVFRDHIRSNTYFSTKGCTIWKSCKTKGSKETAHTKLDMIGSFGTWFGDSSDVPCSGINEFIDKITSGVLPQDESCTQKSKRARCVDLPKQGGNVPTPGEFTSLAVLGGEPLFSLAEETSVLADPILWCD